MPVPRGNRRPCPRMGPAHALLLGPGVRRSLLIALLIGCTAVLVATRVRAAADGQAGPDAEASAPGMVRIPAPAPAAPAVAPTIPAPQVDDDETPHGHRSAATAVGTFNRSSAPVSAEPEISQLSIGLALSVISVFVAIKAGASATGNARWWAAGGVLAGGAVATGLVTCALGQTSPTRHRGFGASLAGALIGALGVVPGLLVLKHLSSRRAPPRGPMTTTSVRSTAPPTPSSVWRSLAAGT